MARCREFDEREVLRKARDLFWARGFADTSVAELTQATGVCRQSLYNTFGSKSELFAAAMADYRRSEITGVTALLGSDLPLRPLLQAFFERVLEVMLKGGSQGCLLANTLAERQAIGAAGETVLTEHVASFETALRGLVQRAQQRGEAVTPRPAAEAARFILNTMLGLSVNARLGAAPAAMRSVAAIAVDAIAYAGSAGAPAGAALLEDLA